MRLPLLAVACALALRCGSAIDEPTDNVVACQALRVALHGKCTPDEIQWLNCAQLPGCTGGSVSKSDIDACVGLVRTATSCADAQARECKISKIDCSADASALETACANLAAALEVAGCDTGVFACGDFVDCEAAQVELSAVGACFKTVAATTTCSDAKATALACKASICSKP